MNSETKNCQNCKQSFVIEPDDFGFYEKMKVPPPTFCPECRCIRRLCVRNERMLYKRKCDLCKKEVVSTYSPDKKLRTYCPECYRSDRWDPREYGRDYDFSRSLFEQFNELLREVPRPTLKIKNAVNCDYSEDVVNSKNCYLCFGPYLAEDCLYSYTPVLSRNCVDVTVAYKSEKVYEVADSNGLYNTLFARVCNQTLDSAFMFDSNGCSDCFGCVNLRNKKYYLFNTPYTKEEYRSKRGKWDLGSYRILCEAKKKFDAFYYATPRRYAVITNAPNSTGDKIINAKNCHYCFSVVDGVENVKYSALVGLAVKDTQDTWGTGDNCQLVYENTGGLHVENVAFSNRTHNSHDIRYCDSCFDSSNLFGCVGLKSKEYYIFNKQYAKEEYKNLVEKIIEQTKEIPYRDAMGRTYRFGEYPPIEFSPYAYNESLAQEKFSITKEVAQKEKYPWKDEEPRQHQSTQEPENLPDHIKDVPDTITKEIIRCAHQGTCNDEKCTGAFKIIPQELEFYRAIRVALPRLCPNCRHFQREKMRSPFKLWQRTCYCGGSSSTNGIYRNTRTHFHGENGCPNIFMTPYSPERKEIVYCEECFREELN